MRKTCQRVAVIVGAVAVMLGMTIGPAAAVSVGVSVSWDGVGGNAAVVSPSGVTINQGDSVTFSYSSADAQSLLAVFPGSACSGSTVASVNAGLTGSISPTATGTYALLAIDVSNGTQAPCTTLSVTVNGTPPPAVPEVPFTAALLGVSGLLFGVGFFLLRRRATRIAA